MSRDIRYRYDPYAVTSRSEKDKARAAAAAKNAKPTDPVYALASATYGIRLLDSLPKTPQGLYQSVKP